MADRPATAYHDGTSQKGRRQKALDPSYVSVDERTTQDLVEYIRLYAKNLKFYREEGGAPGDWLNFLKGLNAGDIVAYIADPACFDHEPGKKAELARPHRVLFFAFLELLKTARSQMNGLTKRHLDFFYREALKFSEKEGEPDKVYVLAEPSVREDEVLLPRGTGFHAGEDALARSLVYRSDENLMVNRAVPGDVKSLFVQRKIVDLDAVRREPDLLGDKVPGATEAERSFFAMLKMALGEPAGGKLAPYPGNIELIPGLLEEIDRLLSFIRNDLPMPVSAFRKLMKLKHAQDEGAGAWTGINETLLAIAQKQRNDDRFTWTLEEPSHFSKNLLSALDLPDFAGFFDTLPEVTDIYGLYRHRDREDVKTFVEKSLHLSVEKFNAMMKPVEEINGRWREMYEILRSAAKRKGKPCNDPPQIREYDPDKFHALVKATLGDIAWPAGILDGKAGDFQGCWQCLDDLERYFHMTAEQFEFIRDKCRGGATPKPWEWRKVYDILKAAHTAKVLPFHRDILKNIRMKDEFDAMLRYALGDPETGDSLAGDKDFVLLNGDKDRDYLMKQLFIDPSSYTYILDVKSDPQADDLSWIKVYDILESARRRKRNWRPAEFEVWENIYAAADAAQVKPGQDTKDDVARWRTFGTPGGAPVSVPGVIGFAVSSPILALSEGNRAITLTAGFTKESWGGMGDMSGVIGTAFRIALSTDNGTLIKENFTVLNTFDPKGHQSGIVLNDTGFQLRIALEEKDPPIVPSQDPSGIPSPYPVLHILLADLGDNSGKPFTKQYGRFKSLKLENIRIEVETDGLSALSMQNDQGLIDPKKPFEPFGSFPVAGSGFYFSHPELCAKKLDRLDFHFEWLGAPKAFKDHYSGYGASVTGAGDNKVFKAGLKLFDKRSLVDLIDNTANALPLFDAADATKSNLQTRDGFAKKYPAYKGERHLETAREVLDWNRYFKLDLCSPDFQHSVYPKVAADNALKKKAGNTPDPVVVNLPYTPKLKKLTVGYRASLTLDLTKAGNTRRLERIYHIEPFGCRDITGRSALPPFLPRFENEGELFIGLRNVKPPQTLSLLFQMDEGSADPDLERMPVRWDYLDGDIWKTLEDGHLMADTTRGLLNTGLVRLRLPKARTGGLLPADQYWIRASIERNARSVADIIGIHAQAVLATFENRANDPSRLDRPLAPFSVTGLAGQNPKIRAVSQPYSSFGGKSPEASGCFDTRVSERLRHKNRALTVWDYERLVLEAFPDIYKVKCLPVGMSEDPELSDMVQVIVVPDIRGKRHLDIFEPKLPADVLIRIEDHLRNLSHPSARVKVRNPACVELTVRLGVYLRDKGNPGYHKRQLNRDIQRFLSPWAFDTGADIVLGGQTHSSLIVNFVEKLPYVDYVAHIELFTGSGSGPIMPDSGSAEFSAPPDAVLVSAKEHRIDLIDEEGYVPELFTGINFMEIELDFKIA